MPRTSTYDGGENCSAPGAWIKHVPPHVAAQSAFRECVRLCARDLDFVEQFEAATGRDLHRYRMPIELLVDDRGAMVREDVESFCDAVCREVWPHFSGAVTVSDILSH